MSSYNERMQYAIDRTRDQFGAVSVVTACEPIEDVLHVGAATASFDLLAPVANHIYFIEKLAVVEVQLITGVCQVEAYDLTPTAQALTAPGLAGTILEYIAKEFWCTRLAHNVLTASAGTYSVVFIGFDITYT